MSDGNMKWEVDEEWKPGREPKEKGQGDPNNHTTSEPFFFGCALNYTTRLFRTFVMFSILSIPFLLGSICP